MSRRAVLALFLICLLLACQRSSSSLPSTPLPLASHPWTQTPARSPAATVQQKSCCIVQLHPEEQLVVGDQVSFEIIAPSPEPYLNQEVTVTLSSPPTWIGSAVFQPYGFDGRPQATLRWAWDTQPLQAGEYQIRFSIPALQTEWTQTVTLLPRTSLPPAEQLAQWQTLSSACCEVHLITNTAAQRDIEEIIEKVEQQVQAVQAKIPLAQPSPLGVVLIPRVIGNGGFANAEINVSYLDRNYTAADFATILRHEMVHVFDQRAKAEGRPSLFVEGIAVYLSGGHYYAEPLLPRAAELLRLNRFLPLAELASDFYDQQHEYAYLEAGALLEYMDRRWGWQKVWETYLEMTLRKGETPLQAIERALKSNLDISLQTLEEGFLMELENTETTRVTFLDVTTLQTFYDTLRTYQQELDPAAYYRTAWMLDGEQMRQKGIVADYLRHPSRAENLALELLLNEAGRSRRGGEYARAQSILEAVESILSGFQRAVDDPFADHPLARNAWEVVQVVLAAGYEPQVWTLGYEQAQVLVTQGSPTLKRLLLERNNQGWQIVSGASATTDDLIEWTQ